jgi:hypothetical protein
MGRGPKRTRQQRRDDRLSVARRACVLLVVMGCVPAVQAEDPTPSATKPATTGTPAKTPAKSAPAASTPAKESTTKKAPPTPPPVPEADDELLEFLGSVDGLEGLEK